MPNYHDEVFIKRVRFGNYFLGVSTRQLNLEEALVLFLYAFIHVWTVSLSISKTFAISERVYPSANIRHLSKINGYNNGYAAYRKLTKPATIVHVLL
jgi:hypothetical protein